MIRTLGNVFLVSPLLCTALPSALKHPQMSFQHACENHSHRDPLRDRFKRSRFAFVVSGVFCAALIPTVSSVAAEKHCPLLRGTLPLHPLAKEVTKVLPCSAAQSPQRSPILHLTITSLGKVGTGLFCVSLPRPVRASHHFLPPTLSQPPLFPHLTMHHHIFT